MGRIDTCSTVWSAEVMSDTDPSPPPDEADITDAPDAPPALRGFAKMKADGRLDALRIIASKGGKKAQETGAGHRFTPDEARIAGRKGGAAAHQRGETDCNIPTTTRES